MKDNKIAVVGGPSSGKSSLIGKLEDGNFKEHPTCSFDIDGKPYKVSIYDSRGFDNNPGIIFLPQFKQYTAFVVVYDITNEKSFQSSALMKSKTISHGSSRSETKTIWNQRESSLSKVRRSISMRKEFRGQR